MEEHLMSRLVLRDLLSAFILLMFAIASVLATAQTFTVLHTFTGGADGGAPYAGMIIGSGGNLYGTTLVGGTGSCSGVRGSTGCGTIFEVKKHNNSWIFNPLYSFQGATDGAFPSYPLTLGPNGTYYGTTPQGGEGSCNIIGSPGCGTVFNAGPDPTPPRTPLPEFRESALYRFTGGSDGASPYSTVIFDQAGNIYGTTAFGGANRVGTVFELSSAGGGNYTETVLYNFTGGSDGASPYDGLILDSLGNLYGTTASGGTDGYGVVFELSPVGGDHYTETVLYGFTGGNDGATPYAGVAMDSAGNLYGNTTYRGAGNGGTVYELIPNGGNWSFNLLYSAPANGNAFDRVTLDSSGNLYETIVMAGAFGYGQALELARSGSNWTFIDLHDFTNGSDGAYPVGGLLIDSSGNVYGTASAGPGTGCGGSGCGVVWEIIP
jgi:hypothetical protein